MHLEERRSPQTAGRCGRGAAAMMASSKRPTGAEAAGTIKRLLQDLQLLPELQQAS